MDERPGDLQFLLDALAENAALACDAEDAIVALVEGDELVHHTHFGPIAYAPLRMPLNRETVTGRSILDQQTAHIHDALDPSVPTVLRDRVSQHGYRTYLCAPLLGHPGALGAIALRRAEVRPFTEQQIARLETFARLAALAVEHAQLRQALEQRTQQVEAQARELQEALDRQTATTEVLRIISESPTDVTPVYQAIADAAARVIVAESARVWVAEAEELRLCAQAGPSGTEMPTGTRVRIQDQRTLSAWTVLERRTIHVPDTQKLDDEIYGGLKVRTFNRTVLSTPMWREGQVVGAINVSRAEVRPFTAEEIALLETFAAQAVIAMENARLFHDLEEALEQQTATAEVLRIIASSPTNLQPVLDAICQSAARICQALATSIRFVEGNHLRSVARHGVHGFADEIPIDRETAMGRVVLEGHTIYLDDMSSTADSAAGFRPSDFVTDQRSQVAVPLRREGSVMGVLSARSDRPHAFSERQLALLETFAAQAVIAIENVRLFKELNERNEELRAALERQTATAEVLDIIARSPTQLQPVLDAIADSAARLFGAQDVRIRQMQPGGMRRVAAVGVPADVGLVSMDPGLVSTRAITERRTIHISDILSSEGAEFPGSQELAVTGGERTILATPLLREGEAFGTLSIRRAEVKPFTEAEIALIETFANQAVIAIENARLFNDLKAALDRQTATSEVLGIIGRSTTETAPVFQAIVRAATRVLDAPHGAIWVVEGDEIVCKSQTERAGQQDHLGQRRRVDEPVGLVPLVVQAGQAIHIPDVQALDDHAYTGLGQRLRGSPIRTFLASPMLRDGQPMGVIIVYRFEQRPFTPEEIALIETFAAQAVIAMENARLYHEIQDKNAQLEVASRHKSVFLANMSHELRTPLNAIISFSEIVAEDAQDAGHSEYLEDLAEITTAGKHLLGLINDILDLSKIEAGRMEVLLEEFEVEDLIHELQAMAQPLVEKNGNQLVVECPPEPGRMTSDRTKVKQGLLNLLSNAAKFTERGTIALAVERTPSPHWGEGWGEGPYFTFSVRDTGIGIPRISSADCSRPSAKLAQTPAASTAAPDWAWPSPSSSLRCWAGR